MAKYGWLSTAKWRMEVVSAAYLKRATERTESFRLQSYFRMGLNMFFFVLTHCTL